MKHRIEQITVIAVAVLTAAVLHAAGPRAIGKSASQPAVTLPAAPTATAKPDDASPYILSNVSVGAAPAAVASSASYEMNWYSINSGGIIEATSSTYAMSASVGQPVVGRASSPSYDMGAGFWYGVPASGCNCPDQGDVANNDFAVDVFDVIAEIGIAFQGGSDIQDPACPTTRGDVTNNDFAVDVFDVIALIGIAFQGQPVPNPCVP